MRRKAGILIPIEVEILEAAMRLRRSGEDHFHGFLIAKQIEYDAATGALTAHGTLYKALGRLETAGLLESEWEDPELAAAAGRPRRRLYEITGSTEKALAAHRAQAVPAFAGRLGLDLA
ncbi:MAG: helix-turn-helix transcriptional regulator [Rhodoglobus sp.]